MVGTEVFELLASAGTVEKRDLFNEPPWMGSKLAPRAERALWVRRVPAEASNSNTGLEKEQENPNAEQASALLCLHRMNFADDIGIDYVKT